MDRCCMIMLRLHIEPFGFELWPDTVCRVLGQDMHSGSASFPLQRIPAKFKMGDNHAINMSHPIQLLVASCYRNWDKLPPDGPLGSLTFNMAHLGVCRVPWNSFSCVSMESRSLLKLEWLSTVKWKYYKKFYPQFNIHGLLEITEKFQEVPLPLCTWI